MPNDPYIANIGILIHNIAQGSAQNARVMRLVSNQTGSRILTSAGDVMREHLKKNGDVAYKELWVFCKNKTPMQHGSVHDRTELDEVVSPWFSIEGVVGSKGVASL